MWSCRGFFQCLDVSKVEGDSSVRNQQQETMKTRCPPDFACLSKKFMVKKIRWRRRAKEAEAGSLERPAKNFAHPTHLSLYAFRSSSASTTASLCSPPRTTPSPQKDRPRGQPWDFQGSPRDALMLIPAGKLPPVPGLQDGCQFSGVVCPQRSRFAPKPHSDVPPDRLALAF